MAIKIKSHGRRVEEIEYYIFYEWAEQLDAGFMFPCNQDGDINFNEMEQVALDNYDKCESGEYEVVYQGLRRSVNRYWEPAIGECSCGHEVVLESNTNQCEACGSYYNMGGQQLSDPSSWGEETGEHPSDILREM
jgi:hypothetical protein